MTILEANKPSSSIRTWLQKLSKAEHHELSAALWSFGYFFCILASYYTIRPIREEMGIQVGQSALQELFTAVFVVMLLMVPVFGWLSSTFSRVKLMPWLYIFFMANLVGFWAWMTLGTSEAKAYWLPRVFYVWTSVYSLFVVSLFWSFMADIYHSEQSKRLYGFLAAGGTLGAVIAPLITAALVEPLGIANMFWFSVGFLALCLVCLARLARWARGQGQDLASDKARGIKSSVDEGVGGNPLSGLIDVVRSPYLLGICVFLFCFALVSTFLYFQSNEMMKAAFPDSKQRVAIFGQIDSVVNGLALVVQFFAFGALIQRLGTTTMLAIMPIVSVVGFVAMSVSPVITTLLIFGVIRRAGEYAVTKPARETLFTVLPADQKYKAKNVIDTLVHRTGDVSSGWIFKGVKSQGFDFAAMSWLAVAVSGVWLATAIWLGRANNKISLAMNSNSK